MQYTTIFDTSLKVSKVCLGTMTWGLQNTEEEAFAQMDLAKERGVNFLDTAELYPVPPSKETLGETEAIIGRYWKARGSRDQWILATKKTSVAPNLGEAFEHPDVYTPAKMRASLEASLRRLQTDTIDLYQLHWPERPVNAFHKSLFEEDVQAPFTPFEPVLETLQAFIKEGKVRYVGVSNETAWGLMTYLQLHKNRPELPRAVTIQNPLSLLRRGFEVGLAEICLREKVSLLAYSPLCMGLLTGKYFDGKRPENARIMKFPERFSHYLNPKSLAAAKAFEEVAIRHGMNLTELSLAFVNTRPYVGSNIIGATSLPQLEQNLAESTLSLTPEAEADLNAAFAAHYTPVAW